MNFPSVLIMPGCGGIMGNIEKPVVLAMEDQTANVCSRNKYAYS